MKFDFQLPFRSEYITQNLVDSVLIAGKIAIKMRKENINKRIKSSKEDIVTEADIIISKFLRDKIKQCFKEILFVDEEIAPKFTDYNKVSLMVLVDPIDGTANYFKFNSNWGISIGFLKDSDLIAGMIYQPEKHRLYFAEKEKGAYLNTERIKVSKTKVFKKAMITFDFPYKNDKKEYLQTKKALYLLKNRMNIKKLCRLGSQVIDIMEVACGKADLFFHLKTQPWDVSAAILIIQEAGGKVYNLFGKDYKLFDSRILITNKKLDIKPFSEILQKII